MPIAEEVEADSVAEVVLADTHDVDGHTTAAVKRHKACQDVGDQRSSRCQQWAAHHCSSWCIGPAGEGQKTFHRSSQHLLRHTRGQRLGLFQFPDTS